MNKLYVLFFMAVATLMGLGFEVSNVRVGEVSPWANGGIPIFYDVTGSIPANAEKYFFEMTVEDRNANKTYVCQKIQGDLGLWRGVHKVVWHKDSDVGGLSSTNVVVNVSYVYGGVYCVIDLTAGSNATSYPVSFMDEIPDGGWTDEYKTTKLVLKRIPKGSCIMGPDQTDETYRVGFANYFYIGVFEVTLKQWMLVVGGDWDYIGKGAGDCYPVYGVAGTGNSKKLRDADVDIGHDQRSFIGKIRSRTGLAFDLPTVDQWEYACRAGTTTKFSYGDTPDGDYMWYQSNSGLSTHPVGTKKANPWGLYDMHGNVEECCYLSNGRFGNDIYGKKGGLMRGGYWGVSSDYCTSTKSHFLSSAWIYDSSQSGYVADGFRLCMVIP